MKLNDKLLKRTESVLLIDKKIKHNAFLSILEKDLKNLLEVYFYLNGVSPRIELSKGVFGNFNISVFVENVKPKKVGFNA